MPRAPCKQRQNKERAERGVNALLVLLLVIGLAKQDVISKGSIDDPRLLGHERNRAGEAELAVVRFELSQQCTDQRTLARADSTCNCSSVAEAELDVHVAQCCLLRGIHVPREVSFQKH